MILAGTAIALAVATPAPPIDPVWTRLAECESGHWDGDGDPLDGSARWELDVGRFEGGLQFLPSTWTAFAPDHFPTRAHEATPHQQVAVAELVLEVQGWEAWPVCSRKLNLDGG